MKNHLLIKTMLLLCALVVGSNYMWADPTFYKISSLDEVADGCSYLFVYENGASSVAMSTTQNTNNRGNIGVTITDNAITYASGMEVITLESTGSANQYYLRGLNGKYLIAVSGQNYLQSSDAKVDAGKFTFAYSENDLSITSTLPAGNTTTWNPSQLRYYSTSSYFSCYGTGQKAITLFKRGVITWESSNKGIDNLIYSGLGLTDNNGAFRNFANTSFTSSAVYKGNAYKGTSVDYIRLRGSDGSGIVTTTSGGKARKIVVTWNSSNNSEGSTIDIYAKSTAYSAASDLYGDTSAKGTKIGSIVKGTNSEITIADNYPFIGIRSKSNDNCYLDNITIYWEGDVVSLSDASDYTPVAKDYAKVTLDRSFVAGWNGIVLPFDLTTSVKTALGATEVKTLGSATESAGAISLGFTDAELPVAAGTPVLVKLNNAIASGDAVINGVEIKTTAPTTVEKTVAGNTFTLAGGYSTTDLGASEAYFVSNTKFYHKKAGDALSAKPFRAYITQTAAATSRMNVNFDLEGSETTGIIELQREGAANTRYYNLCGQQVTQPNKGLYIANGRKVIIK